MVRRIATQALCWAHPGRKFFELACIAASARSRSAGAVSPIALEAVTRIERHLIERTISGAMVEARLAARQAEVAPLIGGLEEGMRDERARLSGHAPVAKAMYYMLKRWDAFARFLDHDMALRRLRPRQRQRGFMYSLIGTVKLNDVDPQARLADVPGRVAQTPFASTTCCHGTGGRWVANWRHEQTEGHRQLR